MPLTCLSHHMPAMGHSRYNNWHTPESSQLSYGTTESKRGWHDALYSSQSSHDTPRSPLGHCWDDMMPLSYASHHMTPLGHCWDDMMPLGHCKDGYVMKYLHYLCFTQILQFISSKWFFCVCCQSNVYIDVTNLGTIALIAMMYELWKDIINIILFQSF